MADRKMHKLSLSLFTHPGQVAHIVVPDGCRVMLLMYGSQPQIAPIDDPGEYEVDAELLSKGRYPVGIAVIDLAHIAAWQAMTASRVNDLLDQCREQMVPRP